MGQAEFCFTVVKDDVVSVFTMKSHLLVLLFSCKTIGKLENFHKLQFIFVFMEILIIQISLTGWRCHGGAS